MKKAIMKNIEITIKKIGLFATIVFTILGFITLNPFFILLIIISAFCTFEFNTINTMEYWRE